MGEEQIGKTDVARRQLLAALHLHWYLNEPVVVYCLAAAAWNVGNDLLKRNGKIRMIEQFMRVHNLSEREAGLLIRSSWNFAKHADLDPEGETIDYSEEDCDHVLEAACMDFSILTRRPPASVQLFLIWYSAVYPEKTGTFMRVEADFLFPGLAGMERKLQVRAARKELSNWTRILASDAQTDLSDNWRWVELRNLFRAEND